MKLKGRPVSHGIFMGKVHIKNDKDMKVTKKEISDHLKEIKRLEEALDKASQQLEEIKEKTARRMGEEKAEIFEAHLMFLDDPEFIPEIKSKIRDEKINAEAAVKDTVEHYARLFAHMENEYMQEREADIRDVGQRIIRILRGGKDQINNFPQKAAVVARDLSPSDTAQLDTEQVKALATIEGSRTSHTAIMARSLEIPAVVGVEEKLVDRQYQGREIIIDGYEGIVILDPDKETKKVYKKKLKNYQKEKENLKKYINKKAQTKDGKKLEVAGNIGNLADVDAVLKKGGDGIGLFRTEFLYMDRKELPSEQEQFKIYQDVVQKIGDKPVIIRTLDVGGDKDIPYLEQPQEMNPFLGYRAIRLCLDRPDLFKPQLKAILRAGYYGNVKLMYPMISSLSEVREANKLLEECKRELKEENIKYDPEIEVGIMIEIPSAVMIGDRLAEEVDFFSIGTNDLIQYTLAVDRINDKIAEKYTPYHPAVLELIKKSIDQAHQAGIWIGMCGEAAGDPLLLPFLLGAGLDEFSMSAISILKIKQLLNKWTVEEAKEVTEEVLKLSTVEEIKSYLKKVMKT